MKRFVMIAINITLFSTPFSALDPRRQERERSDRIEQAHKADAPPIAPAKAILDAAISIVKQYALRRNDVALDKVELRFQSTNVVNETKCYVIVAVARPRLQ